MGRPTPIHIDNQSTIAIVCNPEFLDRTKHIEVRYHLLRQKVRQMKVELHYVPTGEQVANALTKRLSRKKLNLFLMAMGLCDEV
jgi:hypothetical protein